MKLVVLLSLWALELWLAATVCRAGSIQFQPYSYDYEGKRIEGELGRISVPEKHDHLMAGELRLLF